MKTTCACLRPKAWYGAPRGGGERKARKYGDSGDNFESGRTHHEGANIRSASASRIEAPIARYVVAWRGLSRKYNVLATLRHAASSISRRGNEAARIIATT